MEKLSNTGIYKITSPIGKIYIGQSINLSQRQKQYKNLKESEGQIKLHRSFKKYGIETHRFQIVEYCSLEELDEREIYWGNFYNVLKEGLNCRLGRGRGIISEDLREKMKVYNKRKKIKPILQYDLYGNFIKKWDSVLDAEESLGVNNHSNISACCLGKQKSAWGYVWRYVENSIEPKIQGIKHTLRVNQYDLEKNLIKEWDNIRQIKETLGISYSGIYDCINGKCKQSNGFIWKYKQN